MPHLNKAELIDGVVHMPSPVRFDCHAEQHAWLVCWSATYVSLTPGVRVGDNASTRLNPRSEPQPDLALFVDAGNRAQARVDSEGYLAGAPDLVGEVSASSASIDLGSKLEVYRATGVHEYIVWRVLDGAVDWLVLRNNAYELLAAGGDGLLRSEALPGLWLDAKALLAGNLQRVLEALHLGIKSPEHAAFVAALQAGPPTAP
jgi:Putative restriction endonuclease